jgi:hypothetical protein
VSRLTFVELPESYDENTVTTKQLFGAVMALMLRMERLECMVGNLTNLVLTIVTEDEQPPSQEDYDRVVKVLDEFLGDLKEEIETHREVREHVAFLTQPE